MTVIYSHEPTWWQRSWRNCQWTIHYSWLKAKQTVKISNDVERRPKPENLLASLTNQEAQETTKITWGRYKRFDAKYSSYCGSWHDILVYECPNGHHRLNRPEPDSTNWALSARQKIEEETVNLSSFVAEFDETCGYFRDVTLRLRDAVRKIRRGRNPFKGMRVRDISGSYLESEFSISPMLGDLATAMDYLNDRVPFAVVKRVVVTRQDTYMDVGNAYNPPGQGQDKDVGIYSERAILYVRFLTNKVGDLVFGNPLEWAWERLMFSFVIDWIIPIGDYLNALDAMRAVESLTGTVTRKWWVDGLRASYPSDQLPTYRYELDRPGRFNHVWHQRDVVADVPLPRVPTYEPSRSVDNVLQGLALLHSLKTSRV